MRKYKRNIEKKSSKIEIKYSDINCWDRDYYYDYDDYDDHYWVHYEYLKEQTYNRIYGIIDMMSIYPTEIQRKKKILSIFQEDIPNSFFEN